MQIKLPPCVTDNSPVNQIYRISDEVHEAKKAIATSQDAADEEVMDVIQACITYLTIRGYSQQTVDELTARVHEKNRARGYYQHACDNELKEELAKEFAQHGGTLGGRFKRII